MKLEENRVHEILFQHKILQKSIENMKRFRAQFFVPNSLLIIMWGTCGLQK